MDAKRFLPALAAATLAAALPAPVDGQVPDLPCDDTYTAASGETLASVAERCRVSLAALIRLNPDLNSAEALRPGQELRIPGLRGLDAADAPPPPDAARRAAPRRIEHVVQAGQTLAEISARYEVPVSDILDANDLVDPNVLRIGQRLTILVPPLESRGPAAPAAEAAPAEAAPAAPARPTAREQTPPAPPEEARRPPAAAPAGEPSPSPRQPVKRVRAVTGTLTDEGTACRALRTDRGELYLLEGPVPFPVGTRVKVVGGLEETGACEGAPTLSVEDIEPERP